MKRTNNCSELTRKDIGKEVCLMGWIDSRRDHGGVIFIDLRDREGITQVVFNPEHNKKVHSVAESLRREYVIGIRGKIRERIAGMINPKLPTGEIEVFADELEIITKAETPPLDVDDRKAAANDDIRLKYRYIDLRRPVMQRNIRFRHKASIAVREFMNSNGFIEIETPILVRATPEGARDYVVPSRVHPGKFYALPQSPQLYKQILMISGFDKYYQMARCLRDEDLRADRQPEHTQIDIEMSFIDEKDIMGMVERLYKHVFKAVLGIEIKEVFKIISYKDAMSKYGCDKPDIRYGLELHDVSSLARKTNFSVFKDAVENGSVVKCINPEKELTRKEIDEIIAFCQESGAKGMAWMRVTKDGMESSIAKYFTKEIQEELLAATKAKPGSILMFIADREKKANEILGKLRIEMARRLGLVDSSKFAFCWIVDFPLFEFDEDANAWTPAHHMFSMPKKECLEYLESDPGKVVANLFDVVLNGVELGSGSMRIHDPEIQERVMKVIGLSKEEAYMKFGFLLEAYKYGAPMHGGMGLGFDRFVAMMLGYNDIREVIAFPKNKAAECPMDGSPSDIDEKQMKELHIRSSVVSKSNQ